MSNDDYSPMGTSQGFEASTDEASRALADLEADQIAIRAAGALPQWNLLAIAIGMAVLVSALAIPDSLHWLKMGVILFIDAMIIFLFLWGKRHRSVRMNIFALFMPARPGIIVIIGWVVVVMAVFFAASSDYFESYFPWWAYICTGMGIGVLTYIVMGWVWKSWVRTPA